MKTFNIQQIDGDLSLGKPVKILLGIFLLSGIFGNAVAQKPYPKWDNYTNGEFVADIAEEGDYLWLATNGGGLVKYNKANGELKYFTSAGSKLPGNAIDAVAVDQEGIKWIGTKGGGLVKYDGNSWVNFKSSISGLPGD